MNKELKRQIKQDQIVATVGQASAWVGGHGNEIRKAVSAAAVVVVLVGGLAFYNAYQRQEGEAAFAKALDTFHAPVLAELQEGAERPTGESHATAADKYRKAAEAFDAVAKRFGSRDVGRRARYYAALARMELGAYADAERELTALAASVDRGTLDHALVRIALAEVHRLMGQVDKAVDEFKQLADDAALPYPRDNVLMRLGTALEEARKPHDAAVSYRRVADEFPASVYAAEARRRAEHLQANKG